MRRPRVLFFDDEPERCTAFLLRARMRCREVGLEPTIEERYQVRGAEVLLRHNRYDLVILDIMSSVPDDFWWLGREDMGTTPEDLAGIELLRRCRSGEYAANKGTPVFIRTARGDKNAHHLAMQLGATGYYLTTQSAELIEAMVALLRGIDAKAG